MTERKEEGKIRELVGVKVREGNGAGDGLVEGRR